MSVCRILVVVSVIVLSLASVCNRSLQAAPSVDRSVGPSSAALTDNASAASEDDTNLYPPPYLPLMTAPMTAPLPSRVDDAVDERGVVAGEAALLAAATRALAACKV